MQVIGKFKEVDIIQMDSKQTIHLIKENTMPKLNKYASYKIYLKPEEIEELYNYVKMEGLLCKKN